MLKAIYVQHLCRTSMLCIFENSESTELDILRECCCIVADLIGSPAVDHKDMKDDLSNYSDDFDESSDEGNINCRTIIFHTF